MSREILPRKWHKRSTLRKVVNKKIPFTKENEHIALKYAAYIRSLMVPDPIPGVCRFDPCKFTKVKKSKYALSKYREIFIKEYRNKVRAGDCSKEYVDLPDGYFKKHIEPVLRDVSMYEIDSLTNKDFYLKLSSKALSKKHIQNIMDCLHLFFKSASENIQGLDVPRFPKYGLKTFQGVSDGNGRCDSKGYPGSVRPCGYQDMSSLYTYDPHGKMDKGHKHGKSLWCVNGA